MRYRVSHVSNYAYGSPVDLAAHLLHLRPRPLPWQQVISDRIVAEPDGARRRDAEDHFGNMVTWLFLDRPHADFIVTAESVVEVSYPAPPDVTPAWETVAEAAAGVAAGRAAEYRFDSPMAPASTDTRDYAAASFPKGRPVLEALCGLNERIFKEFRFRSGVTTISTPVTQVMKRREGVCQDFTHLMVSALRGLGLPARQDNSGTIFACKSFAARAKSGGKGADQSWSRLGWRVARAGAWLGRSGSHQRDRRA